MEAMEHPYFYPIVKDQGRMNPISGGSPTTSGIPGSSNVNNSPILSPGPTPVPGAPTAQQ